MNIGKFEEMYKLLFDYKHEINKNIPDKFKCAKCKNVLINASQVPCGCRYCSDCVDGMIKDGIVHCPGNTDDCKEEYLLNNQIDFRANNAISKLIVKCPEETCLHECELIKMEEHFRICGKISKKCPFADFGCCNRQMAIEILNEHCQSSNFNHCKILIEMIDNMRNENDSLKIKQINNEIKIEKLENELKVKSELIDSVNEEMQLVKLENENLIQKFELLNKNMEKKFEEISKEMKNVNLEINQLIDKEIIEMKVEKNEMKQELDKLKNVENNLEEIIIEMKRENQESIKSINDETKSINNKSEMMEITLNKMNEIIDKFGYAMIDLTIDKLNERKINNEHILSEYFTSKSNTYNLRLSFNFIRDSYQKSCFSVVLLIYSGRNDSYLSWPFKGDVTISIVNKLDSNINETITKYCEMSKPSSISYNSSNLQNNTVRTQFDFSYNSLIECKVIQNDCFTIKCSVNFK